MPAIRKEFLDLLLCPDSRQPLREAEAALLTRLNGAIEAGQLKNRCGQAVTRPLEAGLVREDGTVLYPIIDGIPIMLIDEAIPLDSLPAAIDASVP